MNTAGEGRTPEHRRHDRSRANEQLAARLTRYRNLVAAKWWIPALGLALGAGGALAVARLGPPAYLSVGRMIVSIQLRIPEGSVYSEEMSAFLGTQAALMQSGVVLNRAQERASAPDPGRPAPPVALKVSVVPKTSIFVLQATGADPAYVPVFLQACMEEYIQVKKEMRAQTSDTTVAGLTEELVRLEKEIQKCEQALVRFQNTNRITSFEQDRLAAGNYLATLHQRLSEMRSEHELLKLLTLEQNLERRQFPAGRAGPPDTPAPAAPDGAGDGPPDAAPALSTSTANAGDALTQEYFRAKQQLLLLRAEMADLAQYLRPKHPRMIAMTEEIARRERLLEIFRQQGAEQLESRKAAVALQIENFERDVEAWTAKVMECNRQSAEYDKLRSNLQRTQALYDRLLSTLHTLDLNKEINAESVTIMERASPAFPARLELSRQVLFGAMLGFGLGVLGLMLVDRLEDRVNSVAELRDLFDEDILGRIPREPQRRGRRDLELIHPQDQRYAFIEAYKNLRSSLLYLAAGEKRPRTLVVTSSVPDEGKSLTSANLAMVLAHAGSRVLLVDGDLRKGNLHSRLQLPGEPGLSQVLEGGLEWRRAVIQTGEPDLFFLPRGLVRHDSSELFLAPATAGFLKAAAAEYDFVILDTAPVMAADDATSLAPQADAVLFVLRAEYTSARVARAALELLYRRGIRVLGLVFNAVRPSSSDYFYYRYSDYYPCASNKSPAHSP